MKTLEKQLRATLAAILLISTFLPLNIFANQTEDARQTAIRFFTPVSQQKSGAEKAKTETIVVKPRYLSASTAKTAVSVYEREGGGFVVISQTAGGCKVIGYSPSGKFNTDSVPPALTALLNFYEQGVSENIRQAANASAFGTGVGPLLDSVGVQLNQFYHENVGSCPSGCVATAMAQIMAYYKYPDRGIGSRCFYHASYGQLCADFGQTTYNWNNPSYEDYKLLSYHVGVAMDMNYCGAKGGSAPSSNSYSTVLRDYFGYTTQKGSTNSAYICTELDNRRPVYCEIPGDPGHAVVLDGYNKDGYFHINFGWGGNGNGYYLLNTNTTFFVGYTFGTNIAQTVFVSRTPYITSKQDSLTLVALHNSLGGTTGWDLTKPAANWDGVLVINQRVVELTLNNYSNQIEGIIPEEIGKLTELRKLNISGKINGTLPASISNLTKLEYLSILRNAGTLTGSLPSDIGRLTNLQYLSLYNILEGSLPASIGQLKELRQLYLPNGNLTGSIPPGICNLPNLTEINLSHHKLTGQIPDSIGKLKKLMMIDLSGNQLTGTIPSSIGELNQLTLAALDNNSLSGQIPEGVNSWSKVVRLELSNNQLEGAVPGGIGAMTALQYLDVSNNKLTSLPKETGNLRNLQTLDIYNNQFTSLPATLNNLTALTRLYASNNKLSWLPDNFGNMKNIADVDLSNNQLTVFPEGLCFPAKLYSLSLSNNKITKFPASIKMISPAMDMLKLDNNELSGPIPESLMTSRMTLFFIENNHFRFEDIPATTKTIYHAVGKQKPVILSKHRMLVSMGDTVRINIKSLAPFSLKDNVYYWCVYPKYLTQGEGYLTNVKPDSILTVVINEKTINNKYYCKVFNPKSPNWSYIVNGYAYINPCLGGLDTDTLTFKSATEEEILAEKYSDSYVVSSDKILKKEVEDKVVTLVPPSKTRGILQWQASPDGKQWYTLSENMAQADLRANFMSLTTDKLVLSPKTPAYYRTMLSESTCNPIYSDTIKVNPFGKVLYDQTVNAVSQSLTVTADSIEVTIPAGLCKENFRLTIVKMDNPPTSPDSVKLGSVYDVTVSFGSIFDQPLLIKMKNIPKGIDERNIDKYKAVYFDDTNHKWVRYDNAHLSLKDSTLVFETNHLTKLSWWYDEEAVWGYTDVFAKGKVRVFWSEKDEDYFKSIYGKKQTAQAWHEAGTPVMIQDIAHYLGEVLDKLKSLNLAVPDHMMTVYVKEMDDDGVVGLLGMMNNYISINRDISDPIALRSLLAHEYMHYLQDKYITASPGNIFWMEANAHLTDRMVWDETVIPVSQSDDYLTDGRTAKNSIFNFLGNSWDYWDSSTLGQNMFGNIHYCYQAGTFIHYMRSYREGNKLKPENLLKETTWLGSWREYLSNYIKNNLKSTIGDEYENFIKYILSPSPNFTLLNTESGNPYSHIIKHLGEAGDDGFGKSLVYNFPTDQKDPQVDKIEMDVPYLATKMILLTNQTPDRATIVNYKRLHEKDKDKKVYFGRYDIKTRKTVFVDITDSTKYAMMLEPRTERASEATSNISFLLLINKKSPGSLETGSTFDASFELTALPVMNITDVGYASVGTEFIHTYDNGSKYPFFISGIRNSLSLPNLTLFRVLSYSTDKTILNDSSYQVRVTFSDEFHMSNGPGLPQSMQLRELTQTIEYNFVLGQFYIQQKTKTTNRWSAYHDTFSDKDVPERLHSISNHTTTLRLNGVIGFTPIAGDQLFFSTKGANPTQTNANTRNLITSMADEWTDTDYDEKGEVTSATTVRYSSTDYTQGEVPFYMWVHYK